MQAFAIVRLQIGFAGLLVMPGLVAAARLHSRKNAHHAGMLAALLQKLFDPVFLPKALLSAHKLDRHPLFGGDPLHVCPQRLAQRLGPLGVIEDPELVLVEVVGHPAGVTPAGHRPLDDDPVVAGENPSDLIFVSVISSTPIPASYRMFLFGSGYAGLGASHEEPGPGKDR